MDGYVTIGTELDLSGIEKRLDEMTKIMQQKGEDAATKTARKMSSAFVLGASVMTTVVGKIMNAIGNSMDQAVSRVDILNNFSNVMGTLGIDTNDAAESVEYLADKLIGLPTTLDEGVRAVQRFTSANKNVKASTEMYLALNNALLAGGTGPQQQAIAMEQMSQAYAKGKMDYKEWLAIMQTAPAQMRQVAEVMGYLNMEDFGEALRKGTISMNDFMKTLVQMNNHSINGFTTLQEQAKKGTQGIRTSITNLKTTIVRAVGEAMQAIGQANIAGFFQAITDTIKKLIPYIAAFVKSFMVAFTTIVSLIGKIGKFFGTLFGKKGKKDNVEMGQSFEGVALAIGDVGASADGASGSAKKLKKELANLQGFDEMNILQEPSDSAGAGGGAGADVGDIGDLGDLSNIDFGEIGEEVKALGLDFDKVTAAIWGLIGALMTFKTLKFLDKFGAISMTAGEMFRIAAGIGVAIMGIILTVESLIKYLQDPSWENFGQIVTGIALAVAGVALAFGAWPIAAIAAVVAVVGIIISNWEKIKTLLQNGIDWLIGKSDWIHEHFGNVIGTLYDLFTGFLQNLLDGFDNIFNGAKTFLDGIIEFVKGVFSGNWKQAWEGIKKMFDGALQAMWGTLQTIFAGFIPLVQGVWNTIVSSIKNAWNGLINFIKGTLKIIGNFFTDLGKNGADAFGNAFKGVINVVLSKIESILNTPIKQINNLIDAINTLPGVSMGKLSTFKLPRLAKGGIINLPGKGVPVGGAIGGERGREAVLPLTDNQQMQLLGEAIGRYITVNNVLNNYMNSRLISREIKKSDNESDFAFNR